LILLNWMAQIHRSTQSGIMEEPLCLCVTFQHSLIFFGSLPTPRPIRRRINTSLPLELYIRPRITYTVTQVSTMHTKFNTYRVTDNFT